MRFFLFIMNLLKIIFFIFFPNGLGRQTTVTNLAYSHSRFNDSLNFLAVPNTKKMFQLYEKTEVKL